jgi:hypothetical protein
MFTWLDVDLDQDIPGVGVLYVGVRLQLVLVHEAYWIWRLTADGAFLREADIGVA